MLPDRFVGGPRCSSGTRYFNNMHHQPCNTFLISVLDPETGREVLLCPRCDRTAEMTTPLYPED